MPPRTTIPAVDRGGVRLFDLTIALIWLIGFSVWFHHFELPNNPAYSRRMLWTLIPYDLPDLIDPPVEPNSPAWSWFFLFQRIPFVLVAIAIWLGAWGHGALILRFLGIDLPKCERTFFSLCVGLSSVSLTMLLLGVCGFMSRWPLIAVLVTPILVALVACNRQVNGQIESAKLQRIGSSLQMPHLSRLGWLVMVAVTPFVICQLIGAMTPQTDFDVVEYHLGGPKEWFQHGQISRLPHNVYTNFPFLSEMLILAGMVLYGDWQWGALAGQAAIAGFAPLTALGLFAAGRRWFTEAAGWLAALVYLTSPWTYRISIIAYAEGALACYLFSALFAVLLFRDQYLGEHPKLARHALMLSILAGLQAGSAMACKYTGLVSVVIPIGAILCWLALRTMNLQRWKSFTTVILAYGLGIFFTIGPWLLKNAIETGNPVYPLAVRAFGGIDRDETLDAKWRHGHAAKSYESWSLRMRDLPVKMTDVMANNDWHSPLMFGLSPLSLFWCLRRRKQIAAETSEPNSQRAILAIVWIYVAWQFFTWWILTHHIDRFYVPMFSAVALLAGIGTCWWQSLPPFRSTFSQMFIWTWVAAITIGASLLYNADVMLRIGGFNAGRLDLKVARDIAVGVTPRVKWLNDEFEVGLLPSNTKVLCVGEASMFHAQYPYLYNTVFDRSLFEDLCTEPNSQNFKLRTAAEIRAKFQQLGITHIDVNWSEILRYREPGSYGYTDFAHPDRFVELQRLGVLGPQLNLPTSLSLAPLNSDVKQLLEQWAPSLITTYAGKPAYIAAQIFPVLTSDGT